jgi:hypothetical protein
MPVWGARTAACAYPFPVPDAGCEARILSSSAKNPVGNLFGIIFQPARTIEINLASPRT